MNELNVYFVDVLLPLHLPGTYTYRVPQELNGQVKVGARVVVQFGAKNARMYSALVRRIHQEAPHWRSKYIMGVLDPAKALWLSTPSSPASSPPSQSTNAK